MKKVFAVICILGLFIACSTELLPPDSSGDDLTVDPNTGAIIKKPPINDPMSQAIQAGQVLIPCESVDDCRDGYSCTTEACVYNPEEQGFYCVIQQVFHQIR